MHVEVSVALNFVISYLYNKLPRRRVNMFGEELERGLKKKFEGHWYPDKPFKGSAFRCVRVSGEKTEPVITMAAHLSGLDIMEVKGYLPTDLTIWIDPSEVSYRIGEKGMVKILYSDKRIGDDDLIDSMDREVQNASRGFNPEAQSFKPIDSLSSSLSNLSLSPSPNGWGSTSPTQPQLPQQGQTNAKNSSTSPINSFLNRGNNNQVFTAATFAQTKFGSTKLKSHSKRPNRLSPTELQAASFSKHQQRQLFQTPWNNRVMIPQLQQHQQGPLSPRHPRQDYMEQQQQRLLLWQQQQQQQLQSSGLLSPIGGSLGDLQLPSQQPSSLMYVQNDLLSPGSRGTSGSNVTPQGTPSPDNPNKEFLDGLNWSAASPYASLQHLLVAN